MNPGVAPRDAGFIEPDAALRVAADHVVAFGQREGALLPDDPESRARTAFAPWRAIVIDCIAAKRVADAMDGSDVLRVLWIVAEGSANLANQDVEIGLHHIRVRPHQSEQFVLRHDIRPALDKRAQEIECLRRQVDLGSVATYLPRLRVDDKWAESDVHNQRLQNLWNFLKTGVRHFDDSVSLHMISHRRPPGAEVGRRPARDLIEAVLANMRQNIEPLKYSVLAPSRYVVYLHPSEYGRLEGVVPILKRETVRALNEALEALNRRSMFDRYAARVFGNSGPMVQNAGRDWDVDFVPDPDGDLAEGDILVDSELLLPEGPELGVGGRTRKITTVHSGSNTTSRERIVDHKPQALQPQVLARLVYHDNAGHHSHGIVKDSVTIGRGGITYPVDVRIISSVDVSREHARIRRDPEAGGFFLIDLSSLGTTLNGRHVPRGFDDSEGTKRENGVETPLPEQARIGLADTVYIDFQISR